MCVMKKRQKQNKKKYASRKAMPYWKRCGYRSSKECEIKNPYYVEDEPKPGNWAYDFEHFV